jgi:flavorubredoxin
VALTQPREIAAGVFWLGGCLGVELDGRIVHGYSSVYLVRGPARAVLVDPGHPMDWRAISSGLDRILGERPLDYVFPTHPEMPHAGNLGRLLTRYPAAVAVGDMRDYHLYYPAFEDRFEDRREGTVLDLGGDVRFELVEGVIKDLPATLWGYERSRRVLFVSDGFAFLHHPDLGEGDHGPYHLPGECFLKVSELDQPPSLDLARWFTGFSLYWSRFTDNSAEVYARVRALLASHPADLIAPAHGCVIDDVATILPLMESAQSAAFIR